MNGHLKKIIKYSITIILVVASLYYAFQGVDLHKLLSALRQADYKWAILPIPIMILSHIFRALRWRTMLKPFMKADSLLNLFSAVMVGYAVNNILPRGGEFVRPWVYAKREKVSFTSVFATIIVERVIDIICLVILFVGAFFFMKERIIAALPSDLHPERLAYYTLPFIALIILAFYPPFVEFMLKKLVKPIKEQFYHRLMDLYQKFRQGFAIIKSPTEYFRLFLESILIWICYALPMYLLFFSFSFIIDLNLTFLDALLLLVIVGVGVTIAPTPGAIGVYHSLVVIAMVGLYGTSKENALAYATVNHGINTLVQLIVGGIFLIRERVSKIPTKEDIPEDIMKAPL